MCGINGFISANIINKEKLIKDINLMNDLIIHRGPDDDGIYTNNGSNYSIAMGMRRLSIIDLHSGKQPISNDDKKITIVFNGEIYNYIELKNSLLKKGITFKTNSDTEVILKLYEEEGTASFKKLDGMFAFSIHDKIKNKVFIARDFFGEKPLYYTYQNSTLTWASELKSIIKQIKFKPPISNIGLNIFFRLTYIPAPYTIYEDIYKLEPNNYIEYNLNNKEYKSIPIEAENAPTEKNKISFIKAKQEVKDLIYESVSTRSIADVPVGTFLSGGVDSSIVSLCLSQFKSSPIDTFSIGFEKKSYDESDKSRIVAKQLGSKHHEFIIGEKDLSKNISEILLNFDEPFADSSSLPTYLVSKKTSDFVKVAMTGDGGDEVFGGYNKYYMGKMNAKYSKIIPENLHSFFLKASSPLLKTSSDKRGKRFKAARLLNSISYNGEHYWDIISLGYTENNLSQYIKSNKLSSNLFNFYKTKTKINKPTTLTNFRLIDKNISLEGDMLVKVDRTSMLNSLECRAPFLNKKIWNYTNSLPEDYLMKGWNKKHILKEAFADQFPSNFLEKTKSGFGAPVGDWLKSSLKKELESYIDEKKLIAQDIFNVKEIQELIYNHTSGKYDNSFKVWTFYCFQKWYYKTYANI